MKNGYLTKKEVEEIKWRELDIKELEKRIPEIWKTVKALQDAQKVSRKTMRWVITI